MKRWIKVTIIVIVSLIAVAGIGFGVGYFVLNKKIQDMNSSTTEQISEEDQKINDLSSLVYASLPDITKEDVVFKSTFEGFEDLIIIYDTNGSEYMNNSGEIVRDEEDHTVVLGFTITYKDVQKTFNKNIVVLKTSSSEAINNIVSNILDILPIDIPNEYVLPSMVDKYPTAKIEWQKDVINKRTNEVEPTIKVNLVDNQYVVNFEQATQDDICFLEAKIIYEGSTSYRRFIVHTKTNL